MFCVDIKDVDILYRTYTIYIYYLLSNKRNQTEKKTESMLDPHDPPTILSYMQNK